MHSSVKRSSRDAGIGDSGGLSWSDQSLLIEIVFGLVGMFCTVFQHFRIQSAKNCMVFASFQVHSAKNSLFFASFERFGKPPGPTPNLSREKRKAVFFLLQVIPSIITDFGY